MHAANLEGRVGVSDGETERYGNRVTVVEEDFLAATERERYDRRCP